MGCLGSKEEQSSETDDDSDGNSEIDDFVSIKIHESVSSLEEEEGSSASSKHAVRDYDFKRPLQQQAHITKRTERFDDQPRQLPYNTENNRYRARYSTDGSSDLTTHPRLDFDELGAQWWKHDIYNTERRQRPSRQLPYHTKRNKHQPDGRYSSSDSITNTCLNDVDDVRANRPLPKQSFLRKRTEQFERQPRQIPYHTDITRNQTRSSNENTFDSRTSTSHDFDDSLNLALQQQTHKTEQFERQPRKLPLDYHSEKYRYQAKYRKEERRNFTLISSSQHLDLIENDLETEIRPMSGDMIEDIALKGNLSAEKKENLPSLPDKSKKDDSWQLIGEHIFYDPMKILGNGSKAVVFEGRYGQYKTKRIAVKAIKCSDNNEAMELNSEVNEIYMHREIKAMETLIEPARNPNIVDFIHSHINGKMLYIALELGKGTLVDYVNDKNASWREQLNCVSVNRGLSEGLKYIHAKDIVHRDLKPQNVFIVIRNDGILKAVIGDFGTAKSTAGSMFTLTARMGSIGFIAPEIWAAMSEDSLESFGSRCNKTSDIFSCAILFYYTLSLGHHPFGHEMTAQDGIHNQKTPVYDKIKLVRNSHAHRSLIENMLKTKPDDRPKASEMCLHPAMWTESLVLKYLAAKSDEFEILIKTNPSKANLLEDPTLIPNGNWMNNMPLNTKVYLKNYRVNRYSVKLYDGKETSIRALLRAVRNTHSHYKGYPLNVQAELGDFPEGHVDFWLKVCPKLLMHVVNIFGSP